ncbi:MAG: DsbA family protein [Patescibacteria group bacterium]|nr:DsbA family protein [Patescibacteria group bacterium]
MTNKDTTSKIFLKGLLTGLAIITLVGAGFLIGQNKNVASVNPSLNENSQKKETTKEIEISSDDNIKGDVSAAITIVEFSDFQCPFCLRFHQTMLQIMKDYPDKVTWVYKHFPLDSIHPQARPAAEASECAAEQDKFWEFSDGLFKNQSELGLNLYKELALELGLNEIQFKDCISSRKYKDKVEADLQQGIAAGVTGTPGSFLNNQPLGGAAPYENLKSIIDQILSEI